MEMYYSKLNYAINSGVADWLNDNPNFLIGGAILLFLGLGYVAIKIADNGSRFEKPRKLSVPQSTVDDKLEQVPKGVGQHNNKLETSVGGSYEDNDCHNS